MFFNFLFAVPSGRRTHEFLLIPARLEDVRRWRGFLAVSAAFTLATHPVLLHAQQRPIARLDGSEISPAEIDAAAAKWMTASRVTGLGLAVLNHGQVVYLKTYGVSDAEKPLPLTQESVMTAASLTKPVFAAMVMQLVHEQRIDLDRPVGEYLPKPLPEYPGYRDLAGDARYRQITMRMLLDHTSGLPNWRSLAEDKKLRIYFTPGSRFAYSGEGILLAQLVVETVTHRSINELMSDLVFRPLGMHRTSMVWEQRFEEDFANGYDEQGKSLGPQRRTRGDSAGSMQTTLGDYARFVQAVLSGSVVGEKEREIMLKPQVSIQSKHEFPTLSTETTPANAGMHLSYGLGWGLFSTPYGRAFFKEGHDDGWRHYVVCFDRPKSGMLIMTNSSNGEDCYDGLLQEILADTFTPLEWEGFKSANESEAHAARLPTGGWPRSAVAPK